MYITITGLQDKQRQTLQSPSDVVL